MSKTADNLREAITGESQACVRYLAFAQKADEEGYPGVARLFRATSKAEMTHAMSHQCALNEDVELVENLKSTDKVAKAIEELKTSGGVKGTMENIQTAIDGETFEFKTMYPAMIQDAVAEEQLEARHSLEYAMSIEMVHAKLFKKALANPETDDIDTYYICPVCGHTMGSKVSNKCPYCGVDKGKYYSVQ